VKKGYGNMILDLRGRTGINPAAANYFANFISKKTFTAGVFLTRKWFAGNPSVPEAKDFEKLFKSFGETGYKANSLYTEKGRIFKVVPAQNSFKGKVFVLTDSRTSKVSEVLVHILKTEKMAMVVGQKTSGSAFMVERISVNTDFELILPVAEFYSSDGKPFEKNGIEPDKTVSNEDILQFVLKNLL
jgi:C-terminal processing protease CtpA/Prc